MKRQAKMRLFTLFSLLLFFCSFELYAQEQLMTINVENASLRDVLKAIEKQTSYRFSFRDAVVDNEKNITISQNNVPVSAVLDAALKGRNLSYSIVSSKSITISDKKNEETLSGTVKKVSGNVKDESGEPVIGAIITVKGTATGTVTDLNGDFTLDNVSQGSTLVISYLGMNDKEIIVNNSSSFSVTLTQSATDIDEVVVVGYGVQKKKLVTGATVQVSGEDLQKLNTVTVLNALQSQTPGLQITQNSGLQNSGYKVTLRGAGTIGDTNPLVIIDGMLGDIGSLSPSDIESMDILKDAASSAIYGARAANGVILITTKQGKKGKPTLSYDGYYGFQNPSKQVKFLDAKTYMDAYNEASTNAGIAVTDFSQVVPRYNDIMNGTWNGTTWLKEFQNANAPVQNHAFNLIGGSDNSNYSLGLTYNSQQAAYGYVQGMNAAPQNDRYTFRVNSDYSVYKSGDRDIIKIGERVLGNVQVGRHGGLGISNLYVNDIRNMQIATPLMEAYNSDGTFTLSIPFAPTMSNPIANYYYYNTMQASQSFRANGNLYLEVSPVKNLALKSSFNLTYTNAYGRSFHPAFYLNGYMYNTVDQVWASSNTAMSYLWENTATYNFTLAEKNNFNIVLGQSMERDGLGAWIAGSNINLAFQGFDFAYLSNAKKIDPLNTTLTGGPNGLSQVASFFGRINYDYQEKYMLTAVLRADGSSNFARGHRWGYFPSVSAGWVMSSESFMKDCDSWLNFLKLRASWGQNGNQSIPNFQYLANFTSDGSMDYSFGTDKTTWSSGYFAGNGANPNVTWETSEQTNIGIDARFIKSKLGLTADWYIKDTKGWLVQAPILASFGTSAPYVNGGAIRNSGCEFVLSWNDKINDFHYGANFNLSFNKNKVTEIANEQGIIYGGYSSFTSGNKDDIYRAQVGYPIGEFFGYKTAGVFQNQEQIDNYKGPFLQAKPKPGDLIFVNTDKNDVIDTDDRVPLGNPNPSSILGLSLNFGYKGFDLNVAANGVFGNKVAWVTKSVDDQYGNYSQYVYDRRWHGDGTSNRYPAIQNGSPENWTYFSDIFLEDGSYVRIQDITLGYDFKQLFKAMPLKQLRLFVTGQNLFTITKYPGADPEVGYANESWGKGIDLGFYPVQKSILFGLNVKF